MHVPVWYKAYAYNLLVVPILSPVYLADPVDITLFPVRGGDKGNLQG